MYYAGSNVSFNKCVTALNVVGLKNLPMRIQINPCFGMYIELKTIELWNSTSMLDFLFLFICRVLYLNFDIH